MFHSATGYAAYRLDESRLSRDGWLLRPRRFEAGGRWYRRRLRIHRWKDKVPDAGDLFRGGVSKRHLPAYDQAGLRLFARETRRAELAHWWAMCCGPVFVLWNPPLASGLLLAYAVLVNLPFIADPALQPVPDPGPDGAPLVVMQRDLGRDLPSPVVGPAGPTPTGSQRDRPTDSRHGPVAQLLIAWAPLSVILVAYAAAQWIDAPLTATGSGAGTNRLGFGLHVAGPAQVDRDVFGAVPSVWLQERLVDGSAHWYDAAAALVYVTHFFSIPLVTAVVWFGLRDRFRAWVATVIAFTTVGVGVYVVYPAAPPWLASDLGVIGPVNRISSPGWDYLHLEVVGQVGGLRPGGQQPGGGDAVPARGDRAARRTLRVATRGPRLASRAARLRGADGGRAGLHG